MSRRLPESIALPDVPGDDRLDVAVLTDEEAAAARERGREARAEVASAARRMRLSVADSISAWTPVVEHPDGTVAPAACFDGASTALVRLSPGDQRVLVVSADPTIKVTLPPTDPSAPHTEIVLDAEETLIESPTRAWLIRRVK